MSTLAVESRLRFAVAWCLETVHPRSRSEAVRGTVRLAAVIASAEGMLHFVIAPLTGHFAGQFEDFGVYLAAAHAAAAHADIYAGFKASTQSVTFGGFDYPPVVAIFLAPLAWLGDGGAATLWLFLALAATLAGSLIVAHTLLPAHWPRNELALLGTFAYPPATYNLWHGQLNPVVFLLLALALRAWVRGEQKACGGFLAGAALLKLA